MISSTESVQRCSQTPMQCCVADPVWIFIYSDGSVFAICDEDFKNPVYRSSVKKVINIESQKTFTPKEIFKEDD